MALYSQWVHGTSVKPTWIVENLQQVQGDRWDGTEGGVAWSDYNGVPYGWGATFRCKRAQFGSLFGARAVTPNLDPWDPWRASDQKGSWFQFSIPTPVWAEGRQAHLTSVYVLWDADPSTVPQVIHVRDGVNAVEAFWVNEDPVGRTGTGGYDDLVPGVTKFDLASSHPMLWGVGISVGVTCFGDGQITFYAAGADFQV